VQGKPSVRVGEPFDLLTEDWKVAAQVEAAKAVLLVRKEIWLPFADVYQTKCAVPGRSFRVQLERVARLGLAA